jgi:hypothetical protein
MFGEEGELFGLLEPDCGRASRRQQHLRHNPRHALQVCKWLPFAGGIPNEPS